MLEKTISKASYECKILYSDAEGTPIIFLHGYSYSSDIWQRLGIISFLEEKKIPFMALNLPYGEKSHCHPKTRKVETNIAVAREAITHIFGSKLPILVGSSLGAHISLQYATCNSVRGLVLNSPTRTQSEELRLFYPKFTFPVTIVYGSKDVIVGLDEMKSLAKQLPNSKLKIYELAGHSAYIKYPDRFKTDLLELYKAAKQN